MFFTSGVIRAGPVRPVCVLSPVRLNYQIFFANPVP